MSIIGVLGHGLIDADLLEVLSHGLISGAAEAAAIEARFLSGLDMTRRMDSELAFELNALAPLAMEVRL